MSPWFSREGDDVSRFDFDYPANYFVDFRTNFSNQRCFRWHGRGDIDEKPAACSRLQKAYWGICC